MLLSVLDSTDSCTYRIIHYLGQLDCYAAILLLITVHMFSVEIYDEPLNEPQNSKGCSSKIASAFSFRSENF